MSKLPNALPTFVQSTIRGNMAKEYVFFLFQTSRTCVHKFVGIKKTALKKFIFLSRTPFKKRFHYV